MIDLASDTATHPSEGMRQAMAHAEVGDEQKREDPTTNRLQEIAADLLGKEAALFLPSATMSNLAALRTHLKPGDGFIAEAHAHLVIWEGGGYAAVAGAALTPIATENGIFTGDQVRAAIAPPGNHFAQTRLICVENTHNYGGGTVWTRNQIDAVAQIAQQHRLPMHLDGARALNAAAALSVPVSEITAPFDSVTLCLSKGLGCPAGAILAGSRDFIEAAWRAKHLLGGALRQSGILAAAGVYALTHNISRLAEDHENARALAKGLAEMPNVRLDFSRVQSNLVFFSVDGFTGAEARERLLAQGVRMSGDAHRLRAVTHLDISRADVDKAISTARIAWQ